jgi:hypothetical protein
MKRLMYTQVSLRDRLRSSLVRSQRLQCFYNVLYLLQLAYDSAFFAFEGQWTYQTNASVITPIGTLQQQARAFSIAHGGTLGVHVPSVALMLDYMGGWTRPCDTQPQVQQERRAA